MTIRPQDVRFGIEIETTMISRREACIAIQSVTGGTVTTSYGHKVTLEDGRSWKAVSDGSIRSPNGHAAEIVSPILTDDDMNDVQEIVRALRRAGARVNESCGIHIHVDAGGSGEAGRGLPSTLGAFSHDGKDAAKTIRNLVKLCYKNDELIGAALGISASRRSQWCQPVEGDFVDSISGDRNLTLDRMNVRWYGYRNNYPNHYDSSRYAGLNLHNVWYRGTVEFRWFDATLHAGVVKSYIQLCRCLTAKAINARSCSSTKTPLRTASAKYDFRCLLLSLGMIGDEYKTARLHLLKNLTGSAAWKNGRPEGR